MFSYNAWLQPGTLETIPSVDGPDCFALKECKRLLSGYDGIPAISMKVSSDLSPESYSIKTGGEGIHISGGDEAGLLYGAYKLFSIVRHKQNLDKLNISSTPAVSRRILNHWDNPNGTIERGYAGKSLFWRNDRIGYNLERLTDYARLLASVGINQISVNNVNVNEAGAKLLTDEGLKDLAKVAAVFRPFNIKLIISVHFDSPVIIGGLETSDPVREDVAKFWEDSAARVYKAIPDLAGFLMKADSEFRNGPAALGRTQDEGANVIAKALKPYGGTIYWRCFIYNCTQDWRDTITDRPKAAYDYFYPLDGKFDDNVIIQVKNGPVDFQVREPNSPLLGAMKNTPQALEFQVAQEYTGHAIDMYNLAIHWEEVFDHPVDENRDTRALINKEVEAIVAVSNTGDDNNWCGHLLSQANLHAFGRMAWDPSLKAAEITKEWIELTFGTEPKLVTPLLEMMLKSRSTYEKYTAPLSIGFMVTPHTHYGPDVEGYEFSKWGTYHRANHEAIGIDRTRTGTGYTAQYTNHVRDIYENLTTCPDNMLLFFHRVAYDYKLKSGQTLLQYIYDSRFEGAEEVEAFIKTWDSLKDYLPTEAYTSVADRLKRQLANANQWRDVLNTYFYRKTGKPDNKGRYIHP